MVEMATRYTINLSEEERLGLEDLLARERLSKLKAQRAQILLKADEGMTDAKVADEVGVGTATVERFRKRAVLQGIEAALERKKQEGISRAPKLDGRAEAHLIALACSEPPEGFSRWTLTMLGDKLVELKLVDSVSKTTIHRRLKKSDIKPWALKRFCIPPEHNSAFVQAMEDVLEIYHLPYDPLRSLVCFDETSKQLVGHVRAPRRGVPARVDDEYKRCGTANIFLAVEPLAGTVLIEATEHRTAVDCAAFLRYLSDDVYPTTAKIVLVSDNLNIHSAACFYEVYPAEEARRLTKRFEMHHTPRQGSWLNIAECQLSVLARQCLDRRIESIDELEQLLAAWGHSRKGAPVRWQFTTADARIELRRLYPIISHETVH